MEGFSVMNPGALLTVLSLENRIGINGWNRILKKVGDHTLRRVDEGSSYSPQF
jgi:hypothetical protein